jgi:ATP-binding cassette, subfamily B, multidrug efflux pump
MSENKDRFMSEDKLKHNVTVWSLLIRLWPYCRRHLGQLSFVIFLIFGVAISARLLPFLIGYAIDHGIVAKDYVTLRNTALAYLFVQLLQTFFQYSYSFYFQKYGNRVLFYVREDLLQHFQKLPMQYFNKTPVGRIVTRLTNDVSTLAELFTEGVITIVVEFIILCSIVVSMALISPKLALIVLFSTPLFVWLSVKVSDRLAEIMREAKKKLSALNSFVAENLNGIKVIQLYNRGPRHRSHFQKLSGEYRNLSLETVRYYAFMQPVLNMFSAVTISLSLYYGGFMHLETGMAVGSMVTFLLNVQDFIYPLREILEKYQQFQNSITSGERVFQVFDEVPEKQIQPPVPFGNCKGELELKQLNFRYEAQLPLVLKNINLKVKPGQSVALVGRTGSGKSTLISLLQRFYEPPTGSILIDGIPIEKIQFHELRRHIGVVQQDNFIFRGSIAENISLGSQDMDPEKIVKACKQVGYFDLLQATGRSLDHHVEERGANLSVGERQLIAFARILAFQPDVLILDEATANIDSQSERIIQQATTEVSKGRTSLIIAHRLSTIEKCDLIVVLDHGEIKEMGSHDELLAKKGLYYQSSKNGTPFAAESTTTLASDS